MSNVDIFEDDNNEPEINAIEKSILDKVDKFFFAEDSSYCVYLAGPIEAYLDKESPYSIIWREIIKELFNEEPSFVWDIRDPNNGKHDGEKYVRNESNEHYYNPYILFRTYLKNIAEADFVVVNLLDYTNLSVGTMFEMGYAFALNKPIICICEEGSKVKSHSFIQQSVKVFAKSLEEVVNIICFLVNCED